MSIPLGTSATYAVLTSGTIFNLNATVVTGGNVGCSGLTQFGSSSVTVIGGSLNQTITNASQEMIDANAAYTAGTNAILFPPTQTFPANQDLASPTISTPLLPLNPGTYHVT